MRKPDNIRKPHEDRIVKKFGQPTVTGKPTERAPDDSIRDLASCVAFAVSEAHEEKSIDWNVMNVATKMFEKFRAKITSGELRVVKKVTRGGRGHSFGRGIFVECSLCNSNVYNGYNFCPGCGAQIVKG